MRYGTRAAGLMSGTSVDGVDAALVTIGAGERPEVELEDFFTLEYDRSLRSEILDCCGPEGAGSEHVSRLNFRLGEVFADAVLELCARNGLAPGDLDFTGSHGQTIYHGVEEGEPKSTLQVGSGSVIAQKTGITTVFNFRVRDLAAGGEGAPLVPYVDHLLFTDPEKHRVMQNIGGIANYTWLPAGASLGEIAGTDTGPGNMLIDLVLELESGGEKHFDLDGEWARRGRIDDGLLCELMSHHFIREPAPKTTGRELFGRSLALEIVDRARARGCSRYDTAATVTAFTVESIVDAYDRFIEGGSPDEVVVSGGGARNPVLMEMLSRQLCRRRRFEGVRVLRLEDLGLAGDAKEALAFAVLARELLAGRPANVPQITGAGSRVLLGEIAPGGKWREGGSFTP